MTNRNFFSSLAVLFRLKIRLLINSFINWKSVGRVFAALLTLAITTYTISAGASDLVFAMQTLPFGDFLLEWVLALISLYLILIVFTGDLLTGHSLNTGQMSSDFAYLVSLPIPPSSLIAIKLFERLLTDYIGLLIMFSGILGIVLRDGFSFTGLLAAIAIYLQISLLIGLAINILTIAMNRFFRKASINNFFSLLGYFSAFLTLFPYLLLSNFPAQSLSWLIEYSDSFTSPLFKALEPMRWLAVSLMNAGNCSEYAWWSAFWVALVVVGCVIFYFLIKLNWLTCSHSAVKRKSTGKHRILRGFLQKELLLLRSDFNVLINAIFMPITIIVLEVYFFRKALGLTGSTQILNMIYAAIIYFCMFGPINAIGAEGKSIAIIESLPIAPGEFLLRKFTFWLIIAEAIFLPASMAGFRYLNFAMPICIYFYIFFFTAACVWISVAISAIFVNFSGKILQQRSTLTGKIAALALMLLAAPIKELDSLSSFNLLIFFLTAILIRQIAIFYLRFRLDQENSPNSPDKITPYVLLILVFVGAEVAVKQFFRAVIPGQDTGLWAWVIAGIVFFLAIFTWTGKNLFSTRAKALRTLVFSRSHPIIAGIVAVPLGFLVPMLLLNKSTGNLGVLADNVRAFLYGATDLSAPLLAKFADLPIWQQFLQLSQASYWFILIIAFLTLLAFIIETAFRSILFISMPQRETLAVVLSLCATAALFPAGLTFFGLCAASVSIILWIRFKSWPLNALFMAILLQTTFIRLIFL
jgi:hypothetical protein